MIVQFQESKVSDTVNEFRAFYISRSYLWESLYWLSPCAILVAGIVLAPSTILFTLLGFAILLMSWLFSSQVVEESVLIIKDFGIQLRIKYRTGSEETKVFIRTLCALTFVVNWPTIPFFFFWMMISFICDCSVFGQRQDKWCNCSWSYRRLLSAVWARFSYEGWAKVVHFFCPFVSRFG